MWKSLSISFIILTVVLVCHGSANKVRYRAKVCLLPSENIPYCNFTVYDGYALNLANYQYPVKYIVTANNIPKVSFEQCWNNGLRIYGRSLVIGAAYDKWMERQRTNFILKYPTLDNFSSRYLNVNRQVIIVAKKCYPRLGLHLCYNYKIKEHESSTFSNLDNNDVVNFVEQNVTTEIYSEKKTTSSDYGNKANDFNDVKFSKTLLNPETNDVTSFTTEESFVTEIVPETATFLDPETNDVTNSTEQSFVTEIIPETATFLDPETKDVTNSSEKDFVTDIVPETATLLGPEMNVVTSSIIEESFVTEIVPETATFLGRETDNVTNSTEESFVTEIIPETATFLDPETNDVTNSTEKDFVTEIVPETAIFLDSETNDVTNFTEKNVVTETVPDTTTLESIGAKTTDKTYPDSTESKNDLVFTTEPTKEILHETMSTVTEQDAPNIITEDELHMDHSDLDETFEGSDEPIIFRRKREANDLKQNNQKNLLNDFADFFNDLNDFLEYLDDNSDETTTSDDILEAETKFSTEFTTSSSNETDLRSILYRTF